MDLDAAMDSVFVQTLPNLHFETSGATFKPNTFYNCDEQVVWNCFPRIPGTGPPRPGLFGLLDQMSLLCPSTTYVLLPSLPFNQLYGDDIELLLDVAETLKRIHDTLNVDMYVVLIFKDVAPFVCQQYAHLFQADFALRGCVGKLIYQSLIYDLKSPLCVHRSSHISRYPALDGPTAALSPLPRCRSASSQCIPGRLDLASPLKLAWKGSIYSADEQYSGFRFLHQSDVGMPIGPVTIASHYPPNNSAPIRTSARPNFVVTLDITSCENTIDLVESWRSSNMHVVFEYDQKFFVASWVPPRGRIDHWHITAFCLQLPSPSVSLTVSPTTPTHRFKPSGNRPPALTALPSDVVDLPVLSLRDMYNISAREKQSQSELFGQTKALNDSNHKQPFSGVSVDRKRKSNADNFALPNIALPFDSTRPTSEVKSNQTATGKRQFRSVLDAQTKHAAMIKRDKRNTTKSRSRQRLSAKVDPLLVVVAMRQSFPRLATFLSKTNGKQPEHSPNNFSWSYLGSIASEIDEQDLQRHNLISANAFPSVLHGIEYQDKDAIAEIEHAILISGTEFRNALFKFERMTPVLHSLKQLQTA